MTRCAGARGAGCAAGAARGCGTAGGRLKASVDFGQIDELMTGGIAAFLADITRQCEQIHEALTALHHLWRGDGALMFMPIVAAQVAREHSCHLPQAASPEGEEPRMLRRAHRLDESAEHLMFYSIRHVTRFRYSGPVRESVMELRMQPRSEGPQTLAHPSRSRTNPRAQLYAYTDHLGNAVYHFNRAARA